MNEGNYYKLPKNRQWLPEGDSPYEIRGRLTDVSCIAYDLGRNARYQFDNWPLEVDTALRNLSAHLEQSEKLIQEFIMLVAEEKPPT